jgi:integrase/recombinase XerC
VSALALDPAVVFAEAARLRETAVKDKSYRVTPLGRLAGRYLDGLAFDNYAAATIDIREGYLAHLSLELAHLDPADIGTDHLRDFLARWKDAAANTRRQAVSSLRVFFEWAYENGHLPSNPARKIRSPRTKDEDSRRRAYARAIVRQLVNAQPQRRDREALKLMYWCALRRNELRHVQVGDIDFANRILTVHGKGGTVLEQNLPEPIAGELELYFREIDAKPDWFLLSPQKQLRRGRYPLYTYELVTRDPRRPYTIDGISRWFQNCRKRAGLDEVVMHELRHTAGTHFHLEGHDLVATQHFLRHANPSTTAKHYVHLDRVRAVSEVQRRMVDPMEAE